MAEYEGDWEPPEEEALQEGDAVQPQDEGDWVDTPTQPQQVAQSQEGEWVDTPQQPQQVAQSQEGEWVDTPTQPQQVAQSQEGEWVDTPTQAQGDLPEAEGGIGSTLRRAAHNVIPGLAGLAGFAATAPFGGPLVGIGAGIGAAGLAATAQEKLAKMFGFDDEPQQQANQLAHPWYSAAGDVLGMLPGLGVGTEAALGMRTLGAGIAGVTDYIMGGDPQHALVAAAGGALLNKPTQLGESVMGYGEQAGQKLSSMLARSKAGIEGAANIATAPQQAAEQNIPTPPPADGDVRFYHGGDDPTSGGSRWVTTDPTYARDFRSDGIPKDVHYVDIPKGDPAEVGMRSWDEQTDQGTNAVGRYHSGEIPEALAQKLQPYRPEPSADAIQTPTHQGPSSQVAAGTAAEMPGPLTKGKPPSEEEQSQVTRSEQQYGKQAAAEVSPPIREAGEVPEDVQAALKTATEPSTNAPEPPTDTQGGMPFVMTNQMKQQLAEAGHSPEQISNMTPGQAHEILAAKAPPAEPPEISMLKQQAANRTMAAERTGDDVLKGPLLNEEGGTPSPELTEATKQAVGAGGGKPPPPEGSTLNGGNPPPPPPEGPNVTPSEKGGLSGFIRGVKRVFGPTTLKGTGNLETLARDTGNDINAAHGKYNQIAQQGMKLLDPHRELVHNMPDDRLNQLVDRQMGGNAFPDFQPTQQEQRFMDDLTKAFGQWKAPLAEHDPNQQFRENYLPGLYKNEAAAKDFMRRWASKGDKGMTMEKQFPTYEEAKNAGLNPLTNDPIEMYTRYAIRARDFLAAEQFKKDQIAKGYMEYQTEPKPGWERIRDSGQMDRPLYAPEDLAAVYNNYVDKGMRAQHEKLYNAIQHGANAWTLVELGANAYHFTTMAHEGIAHDMTRAVGLAMSGKTSEAASTLLKAPAAPILTYKAGGRAIADYLDPNHKSVAMDLMRDADVHFVGREHAADTMMSNRKSFLDLNSAESWKSQFAKAWKDLSGEFKDSKGILDLTGTALKNAARAMQTISHPLFDRYVPFMKAGAMMKSVQDFLLTNDHLDLSNKNGPDYKFAVDQVRKLTNSVDNRFGEMISSHLFMNKTIQQAAQVAMRSFSWTLGAMKEIAGGSTSALRGVKTGEGNLLQKLDLRNENYDPRVAYLIGFPAALAFTSGVTQFLATGQPPGEVKDLALPKTGGRVAGYGQRGQVDERVVTPGYMKDIMGWINHPFQEAYNKLNGLITTSYETARGQDSLGRPVVNPKGGLLDQVKDRAAYALTKMGPISFKNYMQGSKTGSHIPAWAAGVGFRPPSAEYQDPAGYERGQKKYQEKAYKQRESSLKRVNRQYNAP